MKKTISQLKDEIVNHARVGCSIELIAQLLKIPKSKFDDENSTFSKAYRFGRSLFKKDILTAQYKAGIQNLNTNILLRLGEEIGQGRGDSDAPSAIEFIITDTRADDIVRDINAEIDESLGGKK